MTYQYSAVCTDTHKGTREQDVKLENKEVTLWKLWMNLYCRYFLTTGYLFSYSRVQYDLLSNKARHLGQHLFQLYHILYATVCCKVGQLCTYKEFQQPEGVQVHVDWHCSYTECCSLLLWSTGSRKAFFYDEVLAANTTEVRTRSVHLSNSHGSCRRWCILCPATVYL